MVARVGCVDDRRVRTETPGVVEDLDRPAPVLREAFLDLTRLLVGMHVEDELLALRRLADGLEPVDRAGAHRVRRETDARPGVAKLRDPFEVLHDGALPEARDTASAVGDDEQHELDPGRLRGLDRGGRLRPPDVVKLADGRIPRRAHLAVRALVRRSDLRRGECFRLGDHRLPPGPEVVPLDATPQRALEGVAVHIHEAEKRHVAHAVKTRCPRSITVWTIGPARWYAR